MLFETVGAVLANFSLHKFFNYSFNCSKILRILQYNILTNIL